MKNIRSVLEIFYYKYNQAFDLLLLTINNKNITNIIIKDFLHFLDLLH